MPVSLNHLVLPAADVASVTAGRKPSWLKMKMPAGDGYSSLLRLVNEQKLHTVCQSAKCPNMGECWAAGTATLMILGDVCTRSCGFCHIATGRPPTLDLDEPARVGYAVAQMRLGHAVLTSVNRDELPDGGAAVWAHTIREVRRQSPGTSVEVLIPDFAGNWDALQLVLDERPDILNHNIESVPRLYRTVRPQAKYRRSLELLKIAKEQGLTTKTGMMLGLGEAGARGRGDRHRPGVDRHRHPHAWASTCSRRPTTCRSCGGSTPTSSRPGRSGARRPACGTSRAARWSAAATTPSGRWRRTR